MREPIRWLAAAFGVAAGAYGINVVRAWLLFGATRRGAPEERDALLDEYMPLYDVAERHRVRVAAPADVTLSSAKEMDLFGLPVVRAIFRARERILRATPEDRVPPRGLVAEARSIGWGILAETPGHEIVMGAATKPWEPNPVFRALPPEQFLAFYEPGFVKIAWTLRADGIDARQSIFRTETRATTTDPVSRARFRRYWAFLSPGIVLIRWVALAPLRKDAERRARRQPSLASSASSAA